MMEFVKAQAGRIYAVLVAALALAAHYYPDLPSEMILAAAAAFLGLGEAVQRAETVKGLKPARSGPSEETEG